MLRFLPGPLVGAIALLLIILNTLVWCLPLYLFAIIRWLAPASGKRLFTDVMSSIATAWITCNNMTIDLTQDLEIDVEGLEGLARRNWYLVTCNHQSWADILILQRVFVHHIPMLKFFIKQELIWVPIIGIAWWALDFPFMKRYSTRQLVRRPDLKQKDLESTRAACELFKASPVSILNFLEGTRVTPAKQEANKSPFKHLLSPKGGGAALVLSSMEDKISKLVDVTIVYPQGVEGFWGFLCGRVAQVNFHIDKIDIPEELYRGNYTEDPQFKRQFQSWIRQVWQEKDRKIDRILQA
ncbi:MAG: acyltransferase [Pseudomonadales bacterium]|jgi:1-acyl-sn-glycerol-3-phosphate acyltransferase|nr:acyltransferase [Pseudomonadales bacterium]MDP7144103.1 acyltransferase [Pseudomonadales bacterium]MDP7359330.1 acyltransferase [Pseudomonadales bacterium]MDP7594698.1 acyltransferase [Pseudomonadales bacterium]HJN50390.1 acyltransferase [Pseudomonadales bacterium]|tara:strand:- start:261 stop:1151 length:891 start_codon:yes stop_codon:yes gene_type:complete